MKRFSLYSPLRKLKKGDYPVSPFVYLALGDHSKSDGELLLSPQLMTDKEIDETVDRLKTELDELRRKAKKELRLLQKRMLGICSGSA